MVKMRKAVTVIFAILLFLVIGRFYSGVYDDDEFNEKYFFIKNSPTWKWYFYSPRGMSDQTLQEMSEIERNEQLMYEKYIPNRVWSFPLPM